jgi:hypothetical protein
MKFSFANPSVIPAKAGIQRVASATHMNQTAFQLEPQVTLVAQTRDAGFPLSRE